MEQFQNIHIKKIALDYDKWSLHFFSMLINFFDNMDSWEQVWNISSCLHRKSKIQLNCNILFWVYSVPLNASPKWKSFWKRHWNDHIRKQMNWNFRSIKFHWIETDFSNIITKQMKCEQNSYFQIIVSGNGEDNEVYVGKRYELRNSISR